MHSGADPIIRQSVVVWHQGQLFYTPTNGLIHVELEHDSITPQPKRYPIPRQPDRPLPKPTPRYAPDFQYEANTTVCTCCVKDAAGNRIAGKTYTKGKRRQHVDGLKYGPVQKPDAITDIPPHPLSKTASVHDDRSSDDLQVYLQNHHDLQSHSSIIIHQHLLCSAQLEHSGFLNVNKNGLQRRRKVLQRRKKVLRRAIAINNWERSNEMEAVQTPHAQCHVFTCAGCLLSTRTGTIL
jgi:hypothetical protein